MSDDRRQGGPANPFEELLGAPPAASPTGSPVTLLPRAAAASTPTEPSAQALELGFDPGAALPAPEARKPERPELADWREGLPRGQAGATAPADLAAVSSRNPLTSTRKRPLGPIVGAIVVVAAIVVAASQWKGRTTGAPTGAPTRSEA
ncbi:MAG: hypothetical protein ACO3JL_06475, partial [Myxococcota bacterium]